MVMRRRGFEDPLPFNPGPGRRPPLDWATLSVEEEMLVVRLSGWRQVLAISRGVRIPVSSVVDIRLEPSPHSAILPKLRSRGRTRLWRLGAYHGRAGWSFWACGLGRNAVVIETLGVRYRYVVVETADPFQLIGTVVDATGLDPGRRGAGSARPGRDERPAAPAEEDGGRRQVSPHETPEAGSVP